MRFRLSLRARFVSAVFALVFLICGGFYFAVYQFVEVLEAQLMEATLKRELHELADAVRLGKPAPIRDSVELKGFVWPAGLPAPEGLPVQIRNWPSGTLAEVHIDRNEYYAGREDVGDTAVFMLLDLAEIEALEARLVRIAYGVIVAALVAAVLVGALLSRLVTKPVTRLAQQVAGLEPDGDRVRLHDRFDDREIGLIAEAIDRYQERIERFVGRERDFTDDASHELRTPLAVIRSALPLLAEEAALSEPGRERLERIERASRQMHAMIEAMLFLAREGGGWRAEPCALADVAEDLARTWGRAAREKGLRFDCDIHDPPVILAPPGMAASVIGNLLSNAVQHTPRGSISFRIAGDRVIVEDTGPGIAEAERAHIFERRYRGSRSAGFGIGLYVVHRICERLGWRIHVESRPGQGTRFEIRVKPGGLTKT